MPNPCLTALAKVASPETTITYAYKKDTLQTDTVKWSAQLTNSEASNVNCPVVYKLYALDCTAAAPTGFTIASTKDEITANIGTSAGYDQDLCIVADNGIAEKLTFKYYLYQTADPCLTTLSKVSKPAAGTTYAYKKETSQTDTVKWSEQLYNNEASNVNCPVVYKLYASDCTSAAPTGFTIASTKDKITANIGK